MNSIRPSLVLGRRLASRPAAHTAAAILIAALLLGASGSTLDHPAAAQTPSNAPGDVLRIYGVGGVLTRDGTLWQYRPEKKRWLTIDEAFREQGKETRVLPLPVRPEEIREMVTWGFLLTESGVCWLYDIDANRWDPLTPPSR